MAFQFNGLRRLLQLRRGKQKDALHFSAEESGLSPKQLDAGFSTLRMLGLYDKRNDLDLADVVTILYSVGLNPTADILATKLKNMGLSGSSMYTWGQLAHLWSALERDVQYEDEVLKHAFQFFDKDGNGEIDVAELRTTMRELGNLLSEEEIMAFVALMDVNNDGVVGYEEFLATLRSNVPTISGTSERTTAEHACQLCPATTSCQQPQQPRLEGAMHACNVHDFAANVVLGQLDALWQGAFPAQVQEPFHLSQELAGDYMRATSDGEETSTLSMNQEFIPAGVPLYMAETSWETVQPDESCGPRMASKLDNSAVNEQHFH